MVAADQLSQVQRDVRYFVAEDPTQAQEGRGIANYLLCFAHGAVPIGLGALLGNGGVLRATRARFPASTRSP